MLWLAPLAGLGLRGLYAELDRWRAFAEARAFADARGKPLLVVGGPYGSPSRRIFGISAHPPGDVCADLDARS